MDRSLHHLYVAGSWSNIVGKMLSDGASQQHMTMLQYIACKAYYKVWRLAFEGQPIINTGFLAGQM